MGKRQRENGTPHTDILLLELSSQVALDEGGLPNATIPDQDELECGGSLHRALSQRGAESRTPALRARVLDTSVGSSWSNRYPLNPI